MGNSKPLESKEECFGFGISFMLPLLFAQNYGSGIEYITLAKSGGEIW